MRSESLSLTHLAFWKEIIHQGLVSWYLVHPRRANLLVHNFIPTQKCAVNLSLSHFAWRFGNRSSINGWFHDISSIHEELVCQYIISFRREALPLSLSLVCILGHRRPRLPRHHSLRLSLRHPHRPRLLHPCLVLSFSPKGFHYSRSKRKKSSRHGKELKSFECSFCEEGGRGRRRRGTMWLSILKVLRVQ